MNRKILRALVELTLLTVTVALTGTGVYLIFCEVSGSEGMYIAVKIVGLIVTRWGMQLYKALYDAGLLPTVKKLSEFDEV